MKNRNVISGVRGLAVLAGIFLLSIAASAEENPCIADKARLCPAVQPGEGRVAQCLMEHEIELSPACKKNIAKIKEAGMKLKQACEADKNKLCKNTRPGGGRVLQCLRGHEDQLSAACKTQLMRPKDRK